MIYINLILVFLVLVAIHEYGHYIVARFPQIWVRRGLPSLHRRIGLFFLWTAAHLIGCVLLTTTGRMRALTVWASD